MKIFQTGMLRQIMGVVLSHIYMVVLCAVFGFGALWWVLDKPVWEAVFSVLMTLFYFSSIYRNTWECAARDKKSYTETSPYLLKGAVLSTGILILNLILWLCYKMAWTALAIDGSIATYTGILYNALQIFNTFMYTGFINMQQGSMVWYAHIIIYAVPVIAAVTGYIAGLHEFMLTEKFIPFIYEKRKNTNKK